MMNTNNLQIVNIDLVSCPSDLKKFLIFRYNEAKTIGKDISDALEELEENKDILANPKTVKGYVKWFGRKINLLKDPVSESIGKGSKINLQISDSTKSHIFRILNFTDDRNSNLNLKRLPFEIKMIIIRYLDRAYEEEMDKLDKQIIAISKKLTGV